MVGRYGMCIISAHKSGSGRGVSEPRNPRILPCTVCIGHPVFTCVESTACNNMNTANVISLLEAFSKMHACVIQEGSFP